MKLRVNGADREYRERLTIRALLCELKLESAAVAVAVNDEFVPRSEHGTHELRPADQLDIVAPMQGG